MTLNTRSVERLKGVHPDLVNVIEKAHGKTRAFQVSEGLRTPARQRELVAKGASQTQNSRHLTGHAVDIVLLNPDGSADWHFPNYLEAATAIKKVATELDVPIIWGGDWKSLRDGPHFELDRRFYP